MFDLETSLSSSPAHIFLILPMENSENWVVTNGDGGDTHVCHSRLAEVEGQLCGVGLPPPLRGLQGGLQVVELTQQMALACQANLLARKGNCWNTNITVGVRHICAGEKTRRNGLLTPPCGQMSDKGFQPYLVSDKRKVSGAG